MAWRNARSLDVLRTEVRRVAPGATFWTIGDEDHKLSWSDHNPNQCCGVVCAADIPAYPGLDLSWLAARIVASGHPALKYVIWRNQIWFPGLGWQPYFGAYHTHVHVSVGWGPDGRSTGPYDDISPWGIDRATNPGGGGKMALGDRTIRQGDEGDDVWELQTSLQRLGYTTGPHDGVWERNGATTAAVRAFQGAKGLAVDGIVGPLTAAAVKAAIAALPAPPAPPPPPATTEPAVLERLAAIDGKLTAILGKLDALGAGAPVELDDDAIDLHGTMRAAVAEALAAQATGGAAALVALVGDGGE